MADNVLVDNGDETDYTVSSDEAASGQVQRVKLAYSANGVDTHVPADADGVLVNLGSNNDVTVTGTVTASGPLTDAQLRATPVPVDVSDTTFASTVADGADVALGSTADATSANTVIGRLKNLLSRWPAALGQTTKSGSLPVTLASDQDALPVTNAGLTELAAAINGNQLDINIATDSVGIGGGGTQYTEGDTDASITGTAVLWEDGSDTLRAVSASKPLPVGDGGGSLTVDGTVTVGAALPAGTNNIGDVDVLTLPAIPAGNNNIGDVDIASIAAGDNNIGNVDIVTLPALVAGTANIGDVDVLTVPAPLSTTGGGTEATALRVTVASNSTGLLPVSLASVPSHAVTNAGTFAVQDSEKLADNAGFTDGTTKVTPAGLIFDEVAGTALTENDIGAARMDVKRAAVSVIEDETTRGRRTTVTAANALKVDGSAVTQPVSLASVPSHAVTNAGTFAVQVDGAALTSLQLIDDAVYADDAAFTPATSKVLGVGLQADETATDSVDEGDIGAPRMTLDRKVIVTQQPHAAGGCSIYRSIDLDEGTLEVVKNSPGTLYGMWVTNTATATRFIKFYDATSGTAGTGTPVITIGIPGNTSDDVAGAFGPAGVGIAFATGICFGATTGVADADTGAPGANDVIANVFYK